MINGYYQFSCYMTYQVDLYDASVSVPVWISAPTHEYAGACDEAEVNAYATPLIVVESEIPECRVVTQYNGWPHG